MGRPFFGDSYEEFLLLLEEYNNYLASRASSHLADFWPIVIEKYFALVPAKSEKERVDKIEKIKAWFQNHANRGEVAEEITYIPKKTDDTDDSKPVKKTKQNASKKTLEKTVTQLLRGEKKTNTKSNFNTYASLYKKEAAVEISKGWTAHKAKRVGEDVNLQGMTDKELDRALNGERVNVRNSTLQKHYETLPQSIRDRCEAKRGEKKKVVDDAQIDNSETEERILKLQLKNRISAVRNLNGVVEGFLKTNCKETGFSFFLIAAGPDPRYGNEVTSFSCDFMAEKTGESFIETFKDFDTIIKLPFKKLVKRNARSSEAGSAEVSLKASRKDVDKHIEKRRNAELDREPDDRMSIDQSEKIGQSSRDKGKNVVRPKAQKINIISDEDTDPTIETWSEDKSARMISASVEDLRMESDSENPPANDIASESENEESSSDSKSYVSQAQVEKRTTQRPTHAALRPADEEHGVIREKLQSKKPGNRNRGNTQSLVTEAHRRVAGTDSGSQKHHEKRKAVDVTKHHALASDPITKIGVEPKPATQRSKPQLVQKDKRGRIFIRATDQVGLDSEVDSVCETENTEDSDSDVDSDLNAKRSSLRFKKGPPKIVNNELPEMLEEGEDEEDEEDRANRNETNMDTQTQESRSLGSKNSHTKVMLKTAQSLKKVKKSAKQKGYEQNKEDQIHETECNTENGVETLIADEGSAEEVEQRAKSRSGTSGSALPLIGDHEYETNRNRLASISGAFDECSLSPLTVTSTDGSITASTAYSDAEKDDIHLLYDKNMIRNYGYIRKGTVYLRRALGDRSLVILDHWHEFERKKGFIKYDGEIPGYEHMPEQLKAFVRDPDYGVISLPENDIEYGEVWTFWWRIIQPHWRIEGSSNIADMKDQNYIPDSEKWESLCVGGKKGILIAIVGVAIWAETWKIRKGLRKTGKEIDVAVKDVNLVLEMMTMYLQNSRRGSKRHSDSIEKVGAARSLKRQRV